MLAENVEGALSCSLSAVSLEYMDMSFTHFFLRFLSFCSLVSVLTPPSAISTGHVEYLGRHATSKERPLYRPSFCLQSVTFGCLKVVLPVEHSSYFSAFQRFSGLYSPLLRIETATCLLRPYLAFRVSIYGGSLVSVIEPEIVVLFSTEGRDCEACDVAATATSTAADVLSGEEVGVGVGVGVGGGEGGGVDGAGGGEGAGFGFLLLIFARDCEASASFRTTEDELDGPSLTVAEAWTASTITMKANTIDLTMII